MFRTNHETLGSRTMPFAQMEAQTRHQPQGLQQQKPRQGKLGSMVSSARDVVYVCVDALIGRYDR